MSCRWSTVVTSWWLPYPPFAADQRVVVVVVVCQAHRKIDGTVHYLEGHRRCLRLGHGSTCDETQKSYSTIRRISPTCTDVGVMSTSADGLSSAHVHSVLIIDRLPMFAEAMRAVLEASLEFRVAGCPLSLEEAFSLGDDSTPDLVIVDCRVSDCEGAQAVECVGLSAPGATIVAIVEDESPRIIQETFQAGAAGVLSRRIESVHLVGHIRDAMRGIPAVDNHIGSVLLKRLRRADRPADVTNRSEMDPAAMRRKPAGPLLSKRECEVLSLYNQGLTTAAIGQRLFLSPTTVKTHVSRAMVKMGATGRGDLLARCRTEGLIHDSVASDTIPHQS